MFDVDRRVRHELLVAAALEGGGLALMLAALTMRVVGGMPYLIGSVMLAGSGITWHLRVKQRPSPWKLLGVGLAAFGIVLGALWIVSPRPANLWLAAVALPGMHVDMPVDAEENMDYELDSNDDFGRRLVTTDVSRMRVYVHWRRGALPARDDLEGVRAVIGVAPPPEMTPIDDADLTLGSAHHSYEVEVDDDSGRATLFTCGTHVYAVMTLGAGAPTLHARVVDSVRCDRALPASGR